MAEADGYSFYNITKNTKKKQYVKTYPIHKRSVGLLPRGDVSQQLFKNKKEGYESEESNNSFVQDNFQNKVQVNYRMRLHRITEKLECMLYLLGNLVKVLHSVRHVLLFLSVFKKMKQLKQKRN